MSPTLLTELRQDIAEICQQIAAGERSCQSLFSLQANERTAAESYVYVVKVLESDPRIGKVQARRIMQDCHIDECCNVGSLTSAQISSLKVALES